MTFTERPITTRLQQAREAKRISQRALAREVGCSAPLICLAEQGKRRLGTLNRRRIGQVLQVPERTLLLPPYEVER